MSTIEGSGSGGMMNWSGTDQELIRNSLQEMGRPGGMLPDSEAMHSLAGKIDQTLETSVNNLIGGDALADKQTMGAAIVGQTLNTMNSDPVTGAKDPSIAFQEQVLGAHAGLGSIVNKNG
ncbi:MAG: hypothetical protein AB7E32_04015 [Desulfovibrio sp.]